MISSTSLRPYNPLPPVATPDAAHASLELAETGHLRFHETGEPLFFSGGSGVSEDIPLDELDTLHLLAMTEEDVAPLVGGFINLPKGEVTALIGDSNIGKSWFVLDLAVAVALGQPFLGQPVARASVLFLDFEQSRHRGAQRLKRVLRGHGSSLEAAVHAFGYKNLVAYSGHLRELEETVQGYIATLDPGLIVIDGFEAAFGVDSNAGHEVVQAFAMLKRLTRGERTVLILDHPSRAGRKQGSETMEAAGSVQKRAQVRASYTLKETKGQLVLGISKMNDGVPVAKAIRRLGDIGDDWLRHELMEAETSSSVRFDVSKTEDPAKSPDFKGLDPYAQAVLETLRDATEGMKQGELVKSVAASMGRAESTVHDHLKGSKGALNNLQEEGWVEKRRHPTNASWFVYFLK